LKVFVLDTDRKPLDPCSPARARYLLAKGRAAVIRRFPFTIILHDRKAESSVLHEHRVKIDPGSKVTGIAVVQETTGQVAAAVEVEHRGEAVKASLLDRKAIRRNRRARKTRYRRPRSEAEAANQEAQKKAGGFVPPSRESRVANIQTWVSRFRRLVPVSALSQELARFDLQKLENPELSGIAYQQGTLFGYELREYLLEKFQRTCAYCGKTDVPLQVEHIHPKSEGGSDRVSNLTLACEPCNRRKGNRHVEDFLKRDPGRLKRIEAQAKAPLKDATAVNATRWELFRRLRATGLSVECGSGGRTKFNRTTRGLPKAHWIDAACVGASTPEVLDAEGVRPLLVKACGHGKRNRCWTDKHGFPIRHAPRRKFEKGFRTGDIVRADIPNGKHRGVHTGRVAIRFGQNFQIGTASVHPRHCKAIHRADGYAYSFGETLNLSRVQCAPAPPQG